MGQTWRRVRVSVALLILGCVGWLITGGAAFGLLALGSATVIFLLAIITGGNDGYGPRSAYPRADDLKRADDETSPEPHPGPLPPQPPGW